LSAFSDDFPGQDTQLSRSAGGRVSQAYLPFPSPKFVYIGTTQGNAFSGMILTSVLKHYTPTTFLAYRLQSVHPGAVAHIAECPVDSNKLLIGFRKGLTVLWDLQKREALRFKHTEDLCSVSWHHDGSHVHQLAHRRLPGQVVAEESAEAGGHLSARQTEARRLHFRPIQRVFWLNRRRENADLFLFSGGSPLELSQPCMEHDIVDIVPMCDTAVQQW
uniref:WD_REPEATS_REGION domain-containing protein n=1 Tax=Macrostomum lignano TaxID=282301 RepID=A0A1I8F586_9PLAT